MGIDQVLNVVIPIGVIVFFGFVMFKACGSELGRFWEWVKDKLSNNVPKPKIDPQYQEIQYVR